jgi:hypothetical protein
MSLVRPIVERDNYPAPARTGEVIDPKYLPDGSVRVDQAVAAATWVVNHNLGRRPNVGVFSVGGALMWTEVLHVSDNQFQVLFDSAVAGYAIYT